MIIKSRSATPILVSVCVDFSAQAASEILFANTELGVCFTSSVQTIKRQMFGFSAVSADTCRQNMSNMPCNRFFDSFSPRRAVESKF